MNLRTLWTIAFIPLIQLTHAQVAGSIDAAFAANIQAGGGATGGGVFELATDAAGNVYAGGSFTQFSGVAANHFVKLFSDGTVDAAFTANVDLVGGTVQACAVQNDGKILVGGDFSSVGSVAQPWLARLNTDGMIDLSFTPVFNASVFALTVQPDGGILVGGQFYSTPGVTRRGITRLLPSGSVDLTFDPGVGADGVVYSANLDPNGHILLTGNFTHYDGLVATRVILIDMNGDPVNTFSATGGADGSVFSGVALPGNRYLVGGTFDTYDGVASPALICLDQFGAVDPTFTPAGFVSTNIVNSMLLDQNGLILIGGFFTGIGFSPRVLSIALSPGEDIVAGGSFLAYQGVTQRCVTRLNNCLLQPWYADTDGDGFGDPLVSQSSCTAPPGYVANNSDNCPTLPGVIGTACNDGDPNTANDAIDNACVCVGVPTQLRLNVRAMLQGPMQGGFNMSKALLTANLLPLTEPYTALGYAHQGGGGGETTTSAIMQGGGDNDVTDWVVIELRSAATPTTVLATRSALLQADGDAIGADGSLDLLFSLPAGTYHVAIHHRNHLGIMTATGLALSTGAPAMVDFTSPGTATYGTNARSVSGANLVLWSGDVSRNRSVSYTGAENDRDPILVRVGSTVPTNIITGYWLEDVNMDGLVRYTGANNDRDLILVNIGGVTPNNVRQGQLP
jgi:Domain of unknown function (DUF5122) beta-propeller